MKNQVNWREYPENKPEKIDEYLVYSDQLGIYWVEIWGASNSFVNDDDIITHWKPK